jgi:amidase
VSASLCVIRASVGLLLVGAPALAQRADSARRPDIVYEATIPQLQADLAAGRVTSVQLVDAYMARIAAYDHQGPTLNAVITVNPAARREAAARDLERKDGHVRGPLHGIPVLVKDNYGTTDMPTTGGSIALAGFIPSREAFEVRKLREAGAIIIGKTNLHELAAGITTASSLGGQTCNPYDVTRIPGGSSGGTGAGVAASFAAIGWGSDTCGSIRIPAASNNLFGLRPTKGLTSVDGIIPLSHTQDVAGPLARTVMDLAIGLDATIGPDAADSATRILAGNPLPKFVQSLDARSLRGARLGVLTAFFGNQPDDQEVTTVVRAAIDRMKGQGAEIVDVEIPGLDSLIQKAGVIDFEFKPDFQDYMARTPNAPVASLGDIIDRGLYGAAIEANITRRNALGTRDGEPYHAALARRELARRLVVAFLDANHLDAIVYPTMRRKPTIIGQPIPPTNCQLSAVTGLPALSMPAGFTPDSLPIGVELLGRSLSDARLVSLAFSYEQAVHPRRPPRTTPALPNPPKR